MPLLADQPMPGFYMGGRDLNSGPHACLSSTLSHLPSPSSLKSILSSLFSLLWIEFMLPIIFCLNQYPFPPLSHMIHLLSAPKKELKEKKNHFQTFAITFSCLNLPMALQCIKQSFPQGLVLIRSITYSCLLIKLPSLASSYSTLGVFTSGHLYNFLLFTGMFLLT